MVEMSIVAPIILLAFTGFVSALVVVFKLIVLQYAVANGTRNGFFSAASDAAMISTMESEIIRIAAKGGVGLTAAEIKFCPAETPNCGSDNLGAHDNYFITSVHKPIRVLGMKTTITGFAMHRNSTKIP